MKELTQWWKDTDGATRQWLLMGKGPSFARRGEYDISGYSSIALNHVIREVPADVVSIIDIGVARECAEDILRNARFLLMPRYPHPQPDITGVTLDRSLESYFGEIPALRTLSEEGRLIWYNLSTGPNVPESPRILTGCFNAEVVVNILGILGARVIRTLGVDGGTTYAERFKDLDERTRLANGQPDFDRQWSGIGMAIWKYDLNFAPLSNPHPVRIFIGADESQMLGARVLEYSVRKHCPITPHFDTMQSVQIPMPRDPKNHPRTQFSFNRFAIPQLAGYKGRGVYLDADMQVFRDFRELWELPFDGATILYAASSDPKRPKQFSVLLLDCERLRWDTTEIVKGLDEGHYDYDALMKEMCIEPPEAIRPGIPSQWNSLEEYEPGETGLIHYTDMMTQPWVSAKNRNGDLWVACLRDAIREGFITQDELQQAVRDGFARPSLLWQLKLPRRLWPLFTKTLARVLDLPFRPHRALAQRLASRSTKQTAKP